MQHIDLTTDGHVHCRLCHHAVGEMEDYVQAACDKGLKRLIFLEHFETGIHYFETTWLTPADFEVYFATGRALQEKYRGRIEERRHAEIINGSRRKRIARGSGTQVEDVNRLLKQFTEMQRMMQMVGKMTGETIAAPKKKKRKSPFSLMR